MPTEPERYEAPQLRGVPACADCFAALAHGPYQDEWAGLVPVGARLPEGWLVCEACARKRGLEIQAGEETDADGR